MKQQAWPFVVISLLVLTLGGCQVKNKATQNERNSSAEKISESSTVEYAKKNIYEMKIVALDSKAETITAEPKKSLAEDQTDEFNLLAQKVIVLNVGDSILTNCSGRYLKIPALKKEQRIVVEFNDKMFLTRSIPPQVLGKSIKRIVLQAQT